MIFGRNLENKLVMNKITALIEDIIVHPSEGLGKPDALKHELTGKWFRRINREHRIIYQIDKENIIEILNILSLKGHYQ